MKLGQFKICRGQHFWPNHTFQILYQSVKGIWFCEGANIAVSQQEREVPVNTTVAHYLFWMQQMHS